jgi:hypothetical protein
MKLAFTSDQTNVLMAVAMLRWEEGADFDVAKIVTEVCREELRRAHLALDSLRAQPREGGGK